MGAVCWGGLYITQGPFYTLKMSIMKKNNGLQQISNSKTMNLTPPQSTQLGHHHPAAFSPPSQGWERQILPQITPKKLKVREEASNKAQIEAPRWTSSIKVFPHQGNQGNFQGLKGKLQSTIRYPTNFARKKKYVENLGVLPAGGGTTLTQHGVTCSEPPQAGEHLTHTATLGEMSSTRQPP